MTNAQLIIKRRIDALLVDREEKQGHLKQLDKLLTASFILTFMLYLAFSLSLYVGDVFQLQTVIESFLGGSFGIVFFAAISALLAFVLAGTKHQAYLHFSMFRTVKFILLLMVFTGILAEVFNSSGVQDSKARTINSNNAEYNSLVGNASASDIKIDSVQADKVSFYKKKYEQCLVKLEKGTEPHCKGAKGKLDSAIATQDAFFNAQVKASNTSQTESFKRIDEIKNESYNPIIRSLSVTLGIDMAAAISLLMFVFALLFEAMHYYLSVMRRDTLRAIEGLDAAIERLEVDLINITPIADHTQVQVTPSDYPIENKVRWNSGNNATAEKQGFVGFVNTDNQQKSRVSAPAQYTQDVRTVHAGEISDTRGETDTGKRGIAEAVSNYDSLKELIITEQLSVTYRPIKAWMRQEGIGSSDKNRQDITVEYLERMFNEGVLILNPANDGKGINKAKYILSNQST